MTQTPRALHCPTCEAPVPSHSVIGSLAACPSCELVFEVPDAPAPVPEPVPVPVPEPSAVPAAAPPAAPAARAPQTVLPSPPFTVRARVHGSGVELVLPWRDDINFFGRVLNWVVGLGPFLYLLLGSGGMSFIFIPVVAALLYNWLCYEVNATTVLIGSGGFEVSHGPLPNLNRMVVVKARNYHGLRVKEVVNVSYGKYGRRTWTTYDLEATGLAGAVTKKWNNAETLGYVVMAVDWIVQKPSLADRFKKPQEQA